MSDAPPAPVTSNVEEAVGLTPTPAVRPATAGRRAAAVETAPVATGDDASIASSTNDTAGPTALPHEWCTDTIGISLIHLPVVDCQLMMHPSHRHRRGSSRGTTVF